MSRLKDELKRRQTKILVNGLELNKESSLPSNEKFRKGKKRSAEDDYQRK